LTPFGIFELLLDTSPDNCEELITPSVISDQLIYINSLD